MPLPAAQLDARARDAARPLRDYAERFVVAEPDLLYLDGNSLGRLPVATRERVHDVLEREWGERLIRSWGEGWFDAALRLGDALAPLVGAAPGQVAFADATSVNLYKLAHAALARDPRRRTIVTDALNFPSDLYVLQGVAKAFGATLVTVPAAADGVHADEDAIVAALRDDVALVALSHVAFKSGYRYDAERIGAAAHAVGALVLWDLSHSVGSVDVRLDDWGADLAIGCGYKYLNGGPGAPSFLYVRRELQGELTSPIWGWFGQRDPFAFDLDYAPVDGIGRFLVGTPPVLSLAALEPGIDLLREVGMPTVEREARDLTSYLVELVDERLAPLGFRLASPRDAARRGSHVSVAHDDAYRICRALVARDVIPDFRAPDSIRLGIAPLYVGYEAVWRAVDRLVDLVTRREHEALGAERGAVT